MTELKIAPCPFCGGKPEVFKNDAGWSVQCEGGHWLSAAVNGVKCCGSQTIEDYPTIDEAIKAWNQRPLEQAAYRAGLVRAVEIAKAVLLACSARAGMAWVRYVIDSIEYQLTHPDAELAKQKGEQNE